MLVLAKLKAASFSVLQDSYTSTVLAIPLSFAG